MPARGRRSLLCPLLLSAALAAGAVHAAPPAGDAGASAREADEKTLRHLKEVDWPKAYREQDTALLDSILAEEFQVIRDDGSVSTKREELDWISKNKPGYRSLRFVITRLDVFENGTAIVSGTGIVTGSAKDPESVTEYKSSNVLIKRGGKWRAVSSHVSGIVEKPKAPKS